MSKIGITHVALWCQDLERATSFWTQYFGASPGERYESARRVGFASRFLRFSDGAALELMTIPCLGEVPDCRDERPGWAHVAIALESPAAVDALAARMQADGLLVALPRHTGDGFYEAVVRDSEGNLVEITA